MSNELQSQHEDMPTTKAMIIHLQELYGEQSHTLKKLDISIHRKLQVDLILQSLTSSFAQFVMNHNMNKLNYTLSKLINILVSNKRILKSSRGIILAMEQASSSKRKSTWKKKNPVKKQKKENKPKKTDTPKKAVV
uniref:Uncharacterized protein LOC105036291 n=1 Tax=Elaeis guineensis var. tenera TaxID=51953 RepID=A0A6I9QJ85_ELAGV